MGKKSKPPPPPDYTGLAEKTAASDKGVAADLTAANRPNQTNAAGDTLTWGTDPTTGAVTQNTTLSDANQANLDTGNQLRGTAGANAVDVLKNPLSTDGLREYGDYDTSKLQGVDAEGLKAKAGLYNVDPTGNSKAIQDATYGLLAPQRQMARDSEIQRLKSQGLTEDSPAFQRAVSRLDQGDTDAQLKSLIAGQTEYGNSFNRGLEANKSNYGQSSDAEKFAMGLRGQQFGEQTADINVDAATRAQQFGESKDIRNQALGEYNDISGIMNKGNPEFASFNNATNYKGADYSGAAKTEYDANVGNVNAANANKSSTAGGLMKLAGTAATIFF